MNGDIKRDVRAIMERDGRALDPGTANFPQTNVDPAMKAWCEHMYRWGRRVRRDILVIEQHLKQQGVQLPLTSDDFYNDPGDPPPPE